MAPMSISNNGNFQFTTVEVIGNTAQQIDWLVNKEIAPIEHLGLWGHLDNPF
jgi:hypothetical protein